MRTVDGVSNGIGVRTAGSVTELQVTGGAGVPADATAVFLNVAAVDAQAKGFLTVYPCGTPTPNASTLNYTSGSTVANGTIAQLGTGGKVCIFTQDATDLIVDLTGYFPAG